MKHSTEPYILNPTHPISVILIGVGGTGSQVLSALGRIHMSLLALDHPGLHVTAFDADVVTNANVGRQLYSPADVGLNKAVLSIQRINRFYGLVWEGIPDMYDDTKYTANIFISCVDSAKARVDIGEHICKKRNYDHPVKHPYYWLDFGNLQKTGQVVLGTINSRNNRPLPTVLEKFPEMESIVEADQGPSCSLADALRKQDLFINPTLANLGCNLLWKLFSQATLDYHGLYLNLQTMQVRPIPVPTDELEF